MAGSATEDYGIEGSSSIIEGMSSEERCQSGDSLAEWRSCEQVENGTPSTSLPFWDTDNEDDDFGPKPSQLYGKFTWKIENFSQTNKRELRSIAFEVGGYKWYILIYPQGCDVSNHLSLFLCVANHDKLLPGWSHFAQFTIAVVNKDPKKSKYSDTLHRFWKKEHDWGWKKFMELSKVSDGFIVADTLVIKAQVQVIREKANHPFRCLDRFYRRELVRVYLSNVEQIYRRFAEEKRGKLSKLIEEKARWTSFCAFWLGIDQNTRRQMSKDKKEAILKVVVKHFFIEKEVTSTLVLDSINSGLKALEWQSENKDGEAKLVDSEELPAPIVYIEGDMFVLADDVLLLLERAALEPLPRQPSPPKDEKVTQNRTKDGCSVEELNKDSIERDEKRLTEIGRRIVEIFVLAHIFSRIEIAYQEAVALKRQEELIREEEAAGQIGNELKAKRSATEKEKRMKKKQARQRKNSRKAKDKGREEKSYVLTQVKHQPETPSDEVILDYALSHQGTVNEKIDATEDVSDVSDIGDDATVLQPELDDRDSGSVNWDTDTSEIHHAVEASSIERQNGQTEKRSPSVVDDSCSTCSTDSVRSVAVNGSYNGSSLPNRKGQISPIRGRRHRSRDTNDITGVKRSGNIPSSIATSDALRLSADAGNYKDSQPEQEYANLSSKNQNHRLEQDRFEKEAVAFANKLNIKDRAKVEQPSKSSNTESSSPPRPGKKIPFASQQPSKTSEKSVATYNTTKPVTSEEISLVRPTQMEKTVPVAAKSPQVPLASITEPQKAGTPAKSTAAHRVPAMSRPLSAPLTASPRSTAPTVSTVPTMPLLSRSASAAGRLGTEPSPSATCYVPQSYRSVIMGKTSTGANTAVFPRTSSISSSQAVLCSQSPTVSSMPVFSQNSSRNDQASLRHGLTFGSVNPETLHDNQPWRGGTYSNQEVSSSGVHASNFPSDIRRPDSTGSSLGNQQLSAVASSAGQAQGTVSDEFPHLAIINDLLDEDQGTGRGQISHHHSLNRQYTFPRDASAADVGSSSGPCRYDQAEQYYGGGFHGVRGSSGGSLQAMMDANLAHMDYSGYANGHIDRAVRNQWPYQGADVSMLNMSGLDANGYPFQVSDYLNSMRGENGYNNMYRPPNGL